MHLTIDPVIQPGPEGGTSLHVAGDVLVVNGARFDFGPLPEGGLLPQEAIDSPAFTGPVTRTGGVIRARVRVVLPADAALHQPPDPAWWVIADAEGDVTVPYVPQKQEQDE